MPKALVTYIKKLDAYEVKFESAFREWDSVKGIIAVIKATIPVSDRAYDPATKYWTISAAYYSKIEELMRHARFQVEMQKDLRENFFYEEVAAAKETTESVHAQLVKILGENFTKKEYREYARKNHPDLGGDAAKMSEVNRLWSLYNAVSQEVIV
jgi:hypothetical protein